MDQGAASVLSGFLIAGSISVLIWAWWRSLQPTYRKASESAFLTFTSTKYFSGLDALRAISVLAVIWTHVTGPHHVHFLNQGNRGVDLFFAISGFLITTLLLREHRQTGRISLSNFYIRRTLRIFPLYYAVLALYCILVYFTLRGTPKGAEFWHNLPAFATYTTNWFVSAERAGDYGVTFYFSWSLAAEEQFYLFWPPLLMLVLWQGAKNWAPAFSVLFILGFQLATQTQGSADIVRAVFASIAPAILWGVLFGVFLNDQRTFCAFWAFLGNKLVAPATLVLLLAMLQLEPNRFLTNSIMALLVATVCIQENTFLHPVLKWRPAIFIGTISYGIYLMHMLAANVVRKFVGHSFGIDVFVGTTLLVVVLAYLSYRFFESPILRLSRRLSIQQNPPHDGFAQGSTQAPIEPKNLSVNK